VPLLSPRSCAPSSTPDDIDAEFAVIVGVGPEDAGRDRKMITFLRGCGTQRMVGQLPRENEGMRKLGTR